MSTLNGVKYIFAWFNNKYYMTLCRFTFHSVEDTRML